MAKTIAWGFDMTMTKEEGEMLRKEIDAFSVMETRKRIEFALVHWHVVMYRIDGQLGLIRVDLHDKFRSERIVLPVKEMVEVES